MLLFMLRSTFSTKVPAKTAKHCETILRLLIIKDMGNLYFFQIILCAIYTSSFLFQFNQQHN